MRQIKEFIIEYSEVLEMELPRVYANPINKELDNVQKVFKDNGDRLVNNDSKNINRKINEIFASRNHVYKSKVRIKFKDKVIDEVIVGRTNLNLLTINGGLIKITDILDIDKV